MARRAGKAASRKARQRNVPRQPRPARPLPATPAPGAEPDASVEAVADAGPRAAEVAPRPRRTAFATSSVGSSLSDRERAEYHYVERDLRNIGILTLIMAGLLLAAWLLFTATGLIA
jgi:hypothetical protein